MQHPTSSALILGAHGRFGSAAARAFVQAGWQVHGQLRPGATGPAIAGVQWVQADPADTATLAAAARGANVVVQALSPAYTHKAWREGVPRLTQNAIDVTRELGATMLLPASVYNFGAAMPALLHEDTQQAPSSFKGRLRQASEQQILAATRDGGMKAVVMRGGDFFGSGSGSWFDQVMAKGLRAGKFTYPGPMHVTTTWAFLPDMARAFVQVAQQRERLGAFETLHFAGHAVTGAQWAQVFEDIAREQGWLRTDGRLRATTLSWPLLRLAGLVAPMAAALAEMRYLWTTPYTLVNTRMAQLAGPEPHTPFAQAVRQALGELGLLAQPGQSGALALQGSAS